MKRLILLFTLISNFAFAQFPTSSINSNNGGIPDGWNRYFTEGRQYASGFRVLPSAYAFDGTVTPEANGASPGAPGSPQPISGFVPTITKMFVLDDFTAQSSADVNAEITFGPTQGGFKGIIGPTQPLNLKGPYFVKPGRSIVGNLLGLVRPTSPTGNKILFTESFRGHILSADMNYGAKFPIMIFGDSNCEGSAMGSTRVSDGAPATRYDVMTWLMRAWYRNNGQDVRLIDYSTAGWATTDFETLRINGDLEVNAKPALGLYALGTNDVDTAVFKNNVTKFINWYTSTYPGSKLVILGPIPKQGSSIKYGVTWNNETFLTILRNAAQRIVNQFNKPLQVAYINNGDAFSVNDNTQYSSSDTTTDGNHIHINTTGHLSWWNDVLSGLNSLDATFRKFVSQ